MTGISVAILGLTFAVATQGSVPRTEISPNDKGVKALMEMCLESPHQRALTDEDEKDLARLLREGAINYLTTARLFAPQSVEGPSDMSLMSAISRRREAFELVKYVELMIEALKQIESTPTSHSAPSWLLVAQVLSTRLESMKDLNDHELIVSNWPTVWSLCLPDIFERVLIPKVAALTFAEDSGMASGNPK
jgi:hypothetical protein